MYTPPDSKIYGDSESYKNWMSRLTPTTCEKCRKMHGAIYPLYEPPYFAMLHLNCKCILVPMRTKNSDMLRKIAGTEPTYTLHALESCRTITSIKIPPEKVDGKITKAT